MDKKDSYRLARIEEAAEGVWEPQYFDFFDGRLQRVAEGILKRSGVQHCFFGGKDDAERQMLCIYPDDMDEAELDWPILGMGFKKDFDLDHRNVLGALMALGVTRECLGDIDVTEDEVQVVIVARMKTHFEQELTRIAGHKIKLVFYPTAEIKSVPQKFKTLSLVVSSPRLDGIIGKIWGFSRQNAVEIIKARRVRVNYEEITKGDYKLSEGDIISLRGKGKAKIASLGGETKKGNLRIEVMKYIG